MSISNSALIFYHAYTIESKKKSVYFTDFSIKTSFSLEYRDRFERLLGYYLHRANATLTHEVNNSGRRLDNKLMGFTPKSAEGCNVDP